MLFIIFLVAAATGAAGNLLGDADIGYHIRAGEYILESFSVPDHDIFSHITPPLPWTAHEWLSEAVFALIHGFAGLGGVALFSSILIAATAALLYKFLRASGVGAPVSAGVVLLASAASSIHWLARPHLFSHLLVLLWYMALDDYQARGPAKGRDRLYLLPPLMLLWVNLHGGFIAGFILLGAYIAGNVPGLFSADPGKARERLKRLLIIAFFCLLASLLNPKGYKILLFPFELSSKKLFMDSVREWFSPDFHLGLAYEYMLLLMIIALGVSALRLTAVEAILLLIFTHLSLYSARHIPLYALIASPIIGKRLEHALNGFRGGGRAGRILSRLDNASKMDAVAGGPLWPALAVSAVALLALSGKVDYGFDEKGVPVGAVEFMQAERLPGNMFNNDEFGDYIIYAAWPEYKVFFDGRGDMYGEERLKEYMKVVWLRPGWREVLEKYNINWIIDGASSPLSLYLLEDEGWSLIYADEVADIFIKNTGENRFLVEKYRHVKPLEKGS